ncbi:MAG: ABC transporter permease, partial [Acidobacteriaceae bacterium]|nr:ABC transporter permease [Acidobacteriaceae bacterium]
FPDPGRLVTIFNTYPKAGVERDGSSLTNYYERRGRIPACSSLSIYRYGTTTVGEVGSTEREPITQVSPGFFSTLGVGPAIGRSFTDQETTYETDDVVILTDQYWRKHFNADPHVLGHRIRVGGFPRTIVGVLPPGFRFLSSEARLYLPLASRPEDRAPSQRHSGGNVIQTIARLKPGATIAQAQAQIDTQNTTLEADDPQAKMMADAGFRSLVVSLHADHVAAIRPTLVLLQAGVLALLLIGAVNLINLLLIRANGRIKQTAIRQALGASRSYIVSEAVVETTLLTLAGGILGLIVGAGGIRLVAMLGADRLPLGTQIAFSAKLASFGLLAAVVIGVVLAVPIAWFNLRSHLTNSIQSETRGATTSRAAQRLRHGFIITQIALALVLLAASGLLGLSLERAMAVSPGFRPDQVVTGQVSVPWNRYPNALARIGLTQRLLNEISHQPGVTAAGIINNVPFSGNTGKSAASVKGHVLRPGESPRGHYSYGVDGDYFATMRFTLREGRFLTADDSHRSSRVCVVDEDFARYYWPGTSAVGRQLFEGSEPGPDSEAFTVVGVVGSVKQAGLTDESAQGAVYYPYVFRTDDNLYLVVRTGIRAEVAGRTLQSLVRRIDPELSMNDFRSMDDRIADSLIARRSPALLAALFSGIALLLTVIGTYGVLSYAVTQRRREIGVRIALGARPGQIRTQFLSLALRLLSTGIVLGVFGAWFAGQAMRSVLFHVRPSNMPILGGTAAVVALMSVVACLVPSQRAARTSPMEALTEL